VGRGGEVRKRVEVARYVCDWGRGAGMGERRGEGG